MKIILTEAQKLSLEQQHKIERDSRICDRIKAVLLSSEGWTQKQIAQALRIHETTVQIHLRDYVLREKLKPGSGGSSSKLDKVQSEDLIRHLENNTYPSTKEIIEYVERSYGITYTQQGMHNWLSKHKFTYKKPKGTPAKFSVAPQEEFIKKYNSLKADLAPDELIVFMDSVHPTQATKITYGWIKRGVEKLIATVASRKRINITGAINLATMSVITRDYETINGQSTVNFLNTIETSYPNASKIHIIADGGSAHTSDEVALFLSQPNAVNRLYLETTYGINLPTNSVVLSKKMKAQLASVMLEEPLLFEDKLILSTDKLTARQLLNSLKRPPPHPKLVMHILPPYSPNLNPIERLWKVMNEQIRNNKTYTNFAEFKTNVLTFLNETWDTIAVNFKSRINDKFQQLKPVI